MRAWSSSDVVRRSSFVSCCVLLPFFPPWTSQGFEAQPNSPHADDLASKRPYLELDFQIQIYLWKAVCFIVGVSSFGAHSLCTSLSAVSGLMLFVIISHRCDELSSFKCYYCWLRIKFFLHQDIFFRGEMRKFYIYIDLWVWPRCELGKICWIIYANWFWSQTFLLLLKLQSQCFERILNIIAARPRQD